MVYKKFNNILETVKHLKHVKHSLKLKLRVSLQEWTIVIVSSLNHKKFNSETWKNKNLNDFLSIQNIQNSIELSENWFIFICVKHENDYRDKLKYSFEYYITISMLVLRKIGLSSNMLFKWRISIFPISRDNSSLCTRFMQSHTCLKTGNLEIWSVRVLN